MTDVKKSELYVENALYPTQTNASYDEETLKQSAERIDYSGAREKTDPAEIALVKKLDRWIMPTLWIMYWFNYLDRNAIALAKLNNIHKDLNLTGSQYQTCVSILFVGYILGQIPSNMLITRIRPSYYMSGCMAVWAVATACTALATNFTGLLLARFFLGVIEAPYYPGKLGGERNPSIQNSPWLTRWLGALYILSIFYTRKEIATRISILYTGNILATAFAGLIAAGIFHGLDKVAGIAGWQWLFILQGSCTFLIAVGAGFILPDDPLQTKWLTPEERIFANSRIVKDTVGATDKVSTWVGLKNAASDPKLWLFAFMQHMHLAANGFKNFFPTAVATLGFDTTVTL
jgi:MFS family permease